MKHLVIIVLAALLVGSGYVFFSKRNSMSTQEQLTSNQVVSVHPVSHATAWLELGGRIVYTDPVGGEQAFANVPTADVIVVTDIHGDHFNAETLMAVVKEQTVLVVPQAVADLLPEPLKAKAVVMANGQTTEQKGIMVEAIPMYNLPEDPKAFHTKGRGNGYVLEKDGERVYVAGDTSGIPEMRALKNIDIALVPMNLPYTMTVDEAADAVLAFAPKHVYPYHYRGKDGFSDVDRFAALVSAKNPNVLVELLNWYP